MASAVIPAAASLVGGAISSSGAKSAAKTQAAAANNATALQAEMFNKTQENLAPYMDTGKSANNALTKYADLEGDPLNSELLKPIKMDEATLRNTPGYQFNLNQGLKSTQNSAAARGLGTSGAALKGAASYATGLADSTYQNQFSNALTNQQNQYNRLFDITNLGANAAAGLGGIGQKTGENLANTAIGAGKAQAGSQIAGANTLGSSITSAGNSLAGGLYGQQAPDLFATGGFNPEAYGNGLPWSDKILKENIIYLGEENNYPVYEFNYIWSPVRFIGVMAQDILSILPEAVHKVGKYFAVDYSKLGVEFRRAI